MSQNLSATYIYLMKLLCFRRFVWIEVVGNKSSQNQLKLRYNLTSQTTAHLTTVRGYFGASITPSSGNCPCPILCGSFRSSANRFKQISNHPQTTESKSSESLPSWAYTLLTVSKVNANFTSPSPSITWTNP